ncbi:hypothetical protein GUJ93_ZPchr0005g15771 [Zizania palustris]|uniref:Uncharacterized protein n=1 Tax=Zizania palustris TaxID=103762 RepID=A0A8J5SL00_ZIZPA|nr:hypothetical protein GUJ93_ZPchr0005g15771 [Zizania palustris]
MITKHTFSGASGGGEGQDTTAARLVHGVEGCWCVATEPRRQPWRTGGGGASARRRKDSVAGPSVGRGPPAVVGRAEEGSTSGGVVRVWTWRGEKMRVLAVVAHGGGDGGDEACDQGRRATQRRQAVACEAGVALEVADVGPSTRTESRRERESVLRLD